MAPADLRLIRLSCSATLRSAGLLPWLLLLGWVALAAAQEPLFLRGYGLRVLDQGAWAAAVVLIGVLGGDAIPRCRRAGPRVLCSLVLLALLAASLAAFTVAAELVATGACDVGARLAGSADFLAIWCATAIAIASQREGGRVTGVALIVAHAVCAVAISTRLFRTGWSSVLIAAVAGCVVAALVGSGISIKRTK